jgi:putative membrane protein
VEGSPAEEAILAAAARLAAGRKQLGVAAMILVTESDRIRVAEAITEAEAKTSGDIVAVIAPASASYMYAPVLWAALAALVVPFPFIFWTWWPIQYIYALQILAFAVLAVLLMYPPLRLALVPKSVKHARAHQRAVEQFVALDLYTDTRRTGVLIFVSTAERFAEILADSEIHKQVGSETWQSIVDDLTDWIAEGEAGQGLVRAIDAVGEQLARHFPPGSNDAHRLANHLIVLPMTQGGLIWNISTHAN